MAQRTPDELPSVAAWRLRTKLQEARSRVGKSRSNVATALDWSVSKLLRIENGGVGVATADLIALARVYSLSDEDTDELIELARASRRPGIASEFQDVMTREFTRWLEFELDAQEIWQYEPKLVPGILQTPDYATSIVGAYDEESPLEDIERKVQARMLRAEYLLRPDGPRMSFIVDEAALRRGIGNERSDDRDFSVMRSVFSNIKKLNTVGRAQRGGSLEEDLNPNVSVQIMPFAYGAYAALRGPFEILKSSGSSRNYMLYEETRKGDVVNAHPREEIDPYLKNFNRMAKMAPGPELTNDLIDQISGLIDKRLNGVPL